MSTGEGTKRSVWKRVLLFLGAVVMLGPFGCCVGCWVLGMDPPSWKCIAPYTEQRYPKELFIAGEDLVFTTNNYDEPTSLWLVRGTQLEQVHTFEGAVIDLKGAGGVWFVTLSLPMPGNVHERRYMVARSVDQGRHWEERSEDPERSGRLLVLSADEVWMMADAVWRSVDAGRTFQSVALPGTRNVITEQLSVAPNGDVRIVGPTGVLRVGRDGAFKGHDSLDGAKVVAASGGYFAGEHNGALAIRKDEPGAAWIPFMRGERRVLTLAADGDVLRVVTGAADPFKSGASIHYHVSLDGGRTWSEERTGFMYGVVLAGRHLGLAHGYLGELYVSKSP